MQADVLVPQLAPVFNRLNDIVLGKETELKLAMACLLAGGHLLIEDIPGVGKTTLAHALARVMGLNYQRIQFTSDLLPADILGASIFEADTGRFRFHKGPIFAQVVLADEINRATPKAQSALLEAMEERQVTADGITHALPEPFFVIATQNPNFQIGTFPLPESQMDRFLMRIELGYPEPALERKLLETRDRKRVASTLGAVLPPAELLELQKRIPEVFASPALLDYLQAITHYTRHQGNFKAGLSPRALLGLLSAAQAWGYMHGHEGVLPEDVQAVLPATIGHRLIPKESSIFSGPLALGRHIVETIPVP
jgi:MoxR-like ATPase